MLTRDWLARRAGLAADAGLAAVSAVALAVQAVAITVSWGGGYWEFDATAGAVVSVLALARRWHRRAAAVAGPAVAEAAILVSGAAGLPAEPSPAMALGLAVLAGSAIRALPVGWAAAVAGAGLAVVAGAQVGDHPAGLVSGLGWLAGVATGLYLRLLDARRRAAAERVRRDERLELARELHDVVAHHVTGVVVAAQAARIAARRHPDQLDDSLAGIEAAGSEALAAMRRVVGLLRVGDDAAPATPGPEGLGELVRRFDGRGPEVRLRLPDREPAWPPEVTSTVYRVVQESLTNVSRHASHARSVTVDVAEVGDAITVEVLDDAPPATARYHHRGGYGLVGMRERVEALGGTLRAGPRSGAGWSVCATLPVPVGERR